MKYYVIAYYIFTPIEDPHLEVKKIQVFCKNRDMKGRIYISEEGVNAQLSGAIEDARAYIEWMKLDPRFKNIDFKIHEDDRNVFSKMTVKYRKQIVALDRKVDIKNTGRHLSAAEWDAMLDQIDEDTVVIDVRNDYEWKVGHFTGAELPKLETFRQFPEYTQKLKEARDPKKTKVMMYCTGGIRCEVFSAYMKEEGFENVYQLNGGVIRYGIEKGHRHWSGKLFVFDDRMVVPISEKNKETISHCIYCNKEADRYYNCSNMDCNDLLIACPECFKAHDGVCSQKCHAEGRLRPIGDGDMKTPFRKLPFEKKKELRSHCGCC